MTAPFGDRVVEAVAARGPACVGIDPRPAWLPRDVRRNADDPAGACRAWAAAVLEIAAPHVAAVKVQVAFHEVLGPAGMEVYADVLGMARERGLLTIGDVKRGDIGSTARAYAAAHLASDAPFEADAVTLSPYLGTDSIRPFLEAADGEKGLFVLVKTSNPSGAEVQDLATRPAEAPTPVEASAPPGADDPADPAPPVDAVPLHRRVADLVEGLARETAGPEGFGSVGAVCGATHPEAASVLRRAMPHAVILAPGYGAQGAGADDLVPFFDGRGRGALIPSSRGATFPWRVDPETYGDRPWREAVEAAVRRLADDARGAAARAADR